MPNIVSNKFIVSNKEIDMLYSYVTSSTFLNTEQLKERDDLCSQFWVPAMFLIQRVALAAVQ
jgi:hypothetical protein